jgi:hypothetical protein
MGAYLQRQFLFGSYPQEPAERAVADALRSIGGGSPAWEKLREGHHFRDVRYSGQRFRGVYSAASGRTRWYAFSPIRWQAAGREGNRLFLRTVPVLEAMPADDRLLYWLNSAFMRTAFQDADALLDPDGSPAVRCIPERVMIEGRMTRQFFGLSSAQTAICTPYAAAGCDIPLCLRADGVPQPDGIAGVRPVLECIVIE